MNLFELKSKFKPAGDQPQAIKILNDGLKKKFNFQTLLGVTGSGKTFSMANVLEKYQKPTLVLAPNKTLAAQLYREYKDFFPRNKVCYFVSYYDYYQPEAYLPASDTYIEKEAMINEEIERLRHEATSALLSREDVIIVSSVSCIYNLGLPTRYFEATLKLHNGQILTRVDLIKQLVKIHFKRTQGTLKRGEFRVHGDYFEISPASGEIIYLVHLKNQEISSLKVVEPLTYHLRQELKELIVWPPKHFVTTLPEREKAVKDIKEELKDRLEFFLKNKKYLEAERLERKTKNDLLMIKTVGYCHSIENYSRHFTGRLAGEPPETLLSYFPQKNGKPDFLTIVDESHIALPQVNGMYMGDRSRKQILVEYGFRLPSAIDNRPLKFQEFLQRIGPAIFTSATPGQFELKQSKQIAEQIIRPTYLVDPAMIIRPVFDRKKQASQIDDLLKEIKNSTDNKERVLVNALTKKTCEDLTDFLEKQGIKVNYMHSDTETLKRIEILKGFRQGDFDVLVGVNLLREGLDLPEVGLVVVLDADREGFLRSSQALIQLMGRASRNVKGRVILYADTMTSSLKQAKKEVDRRRIKQLRYNKEHNVSPQGITKEIKNLIDIIE